MAKSKHDKKVEEAQSRLDYLAKTGNLMSAVAHEFAVNKTVYYSEACGDLGLLFYANEDGGMPENVIKEINKINDSGDVVYMVTHEYLEFGECWDLWIITDEDVDNESRDYMRKDFEHGMQFSYVVNNSVPEFSEYGTIAYKVCGGGPVRNG